MPISMKQVVEDKLNSTSSWPMNNKQLVKQTRVRLYATDCTDILCNSILQGPKKRNTRKEVLACPLFSFFRHH